MARPIPQIDIDLSKVLNDNIKPKETKSIIEITVDTIRNKSTKNLILGTITVRPSPAVSEELKPAVIPKPEPFKSDEPFEKPALAFVPSKPIPHSPKISPSSIPNPNPSVTANKPEPGYPSYGGFLYNIPGYSAFQPVNFSNSVQLPATPMQTETSKPEFKLFTPITTRENKEPVEEKVDEATENKEAQTPRRSQETSKQQDFEEHFTAEIIPAVSKSDANKSQGVESKMNITSLAQGSGGSVTIPTQINKDTKKKPERYSLKTSIPICKIDMKYVSTPVDTAFQNAIKKPVFNPAFQKESTEKPKLEIQSNIVIKTASKEAETKEKTPATPVSVVHSNSITTLINAAEAINKNDGQFRVPEPKADISKETKEMSPVVSKASSVSRPIFNPVSVESTKPNFPNKPPEGGFNEQKNQLVLLQNKNSPNTKMLLTIQQNPQVLLQRANFESKNLQAPSRLSNQSKKSKDEGIAEASSKVVALKRLHQDNCDENDFENLITENQIYGNKIVVKEKSQGTQQEDWKNKIKIDIKLDKTQSETKNVVLQPNFVYLSNVQFPGNLMMIKNSSKICQTTDSTKMKVSPNENRTTEANIILNNNNNHESNTMTKNPKTQNFLVNKDIHVLKTSNNVLQTLSNNNNKTDVLQTNQKVVMTPQVVYQMPIVVTEADNKVKEPKVTIQKKDLVKPMNAKPDKVIITCQVDTKIPKIVIANLRPKIAKQEEVSMLDFYEQKKRSKRLKYLSNGNKDIPKTDSSNQSAKKNPTKAQIKVITPDKINAEIFKEFSYMKGRLICDTESDSEYGEDDLNEYNTIIEKYGAHYNENAKAEFLASFSLASKEVFREKQLERHERTLKCDAIATAYIAAGRLDPPEDQSQGPDTPSETTPCPEERKRATQKKHFFLNHLKLIQVSKTYKTEFEKSWREILRERNRRNGIANAPEPFDPDGQLQILTEIKKSVNENNDLIKKRLDSLGDEYSDIRILAEKNFSELDRLSKMADQSVKLFSGKDMKKRDLNPGFDSENIKKLKLEPKDYPKLNIPDISKIISLKTEEYSMAPVTTQATSMDEPSNSASCGVEMTKEVGCQVDEKIIWSGFETFIKTFREYEKARKKEMGDLHRCNTRLRVECAHITRSASRESDRARALLAERQHLAGEEATLRNSLDKLTRAIEAVRRS